VQAVIDLNDRQLRRVLDQALRTRPAIELEPRTCHETTLVGELRPAEDGGLLVTTAPPAAHGCELVAGLYVDARFVLSGQLYLFSSCITDIRTDADVWRLRLEPPDAMHVANRRRFERRTLAEFSQVRIWSASAPTPYIGELCNVSGEGLACRLVRGELDEVLLVGDAVRLTFDLPGANEHFEFPATICTKSVSSDGHQLIVGLEFMRDAATADQRTTINRLQAVLCELTINLSESDGVE
jgi:hypothetical protein